MVWFGEYTFQRKRNDRLSTNILDDDVLLREDEEYNKRISVDIWSVI